MLLYRSLRSCFFYFFFYFNVPEHKQSTKSSIIREMMKVPLSRFLFLFFFKIFFKAELQLKFCSDRLQQSASVL